MNFLTKVLGAEKFVPVATCCNLHTNKYGQLIGCAIALVLLIIGRGFWFLSVHAFYAYWLLLSLTMFLIILRSYRVLAIEQYDLVVWPRILGMLVAISFLSLNPLKLVGSCLLFSIISVWLVSRQYLSGMLSGFMFHFLPHDYALESSINALELFFVSGVLANMTTKFICSLL